MSCCCQIISQEDFKCLVPMSNAIDYESLLPFIARSWNEELYEILCKDLHAYIEDKVCNGTPNADDLLLIEKIKPVMVFATIIKFIPWHHNRIERFGVVVKDTDESTPSSKEGQEDLLKDCRNALTIYTSKLVTYLNALDPNGNLYELYESGCGTCGNKQSLPNNAFMIGIV